MQPVRRTVDHDSYLSALHLPPKMDVDGKVDRLWQKVLIVPTRPSPFPQKALIHHIKSDSIGLIKSLQWYGHDIDDRVEIQGEYYAPIHYAIAKTHDLAAAYLLSQGANVQQTWIKEKGKNKNAIDLLNQSPEKAVAILKTLCMLGVESSVLLNLFAFSGLEKQVKQKFVVDPQVREQLHKYSKKEQFCLFLTLLEGSFYYSSSPSQLAEFMRNCKSGHLLSFDAEISGNDIMVYALYLIVGEMYSLYAQIFKPMPGHKLLDAKSQQELEIKQLSTHVLDTFMYNFGLRRNAKYSVDPEHLEDIPTGSFLFFDFKGEGICHIAFFFKHLYRHYVIYHFMTQPPRLIEEDEIAQLEELMKKVNIACIQTKEDKFYVLDGGSSSVKLEEAQTHIKQMLALHPMEIYWGESEFLAD